MPSDVLACFTAICSRQTEHTSSYRDIWWGIRLWWCLIARPASRPLRMISTISLLLLLLLRLLLVLLLLLLLWLLLYMTEVIRLAWQQCSAVTTSWKNFLWNSVPRLLFFYKCANNQQKRAKWRKSKRREWKLQFFCAYWTTNISATYDAETITDIQKNTKNKLWHTSG